MNPLLHSSTALLVLALSCRPATAQQDPPPWWRVNDNVTVSLAWDFNTPPPWSPTLQVVPGWYNPTVTTFLGSPNLAWIPTLTSHTGCVGLVGTGTPQTASLELKVDNDPHIDWIKVFWFQFDEFRGTSGGIAASIRKDLSKYGRATVTEEDRVSIGSGWETVTITAKLIPQPDDEKLDWSFLESAFGTVGIDNLFVNSKCVKPGDDEKGEALGKDQGTALDLFAATTGKDCVAAAATEGPGPGFTKTYWASVRASIAGSLHEIVRMNQAGTVIGTTVLPDSTLQAPQGAMDLAVERLPIAGQYFIYAIVDRRPSGGTVVLRTLDQNGVPQPDVVLTGFPAIPPQQFGLAFDPAGDFGAGTFWVTGDQTTNAYEFSRLGALLETRTITVSVPGAGFAGLGYDPTYGYFYGFSPTPRPSPFGPLRANGFEWSGHDFQATGSEFLGNLNVSLSPPPRGGTATGLEVYRSGANGDFRFVCVVRDSATNHGMLYELSGPFRFGWSQMGTCGMQGGPPFEGGATFAVNLRGVPTATLGILYAGLSNTTFSGSPLPIPLALLGPGLEESSLAVSLDVNLGGSLPVSPGTFVQPVLLPPGGGLSYVPVYFQWILLDPTVPGLLVLSQAGKTIAY